MPVVSKALTLPDLPPPPPGKTGWPWTEQTEPLPEQMSDGSEWPRISIVTPSYNQGQFIEETIRSVLLQGYPHLEYIIIDGGSTDKTVEIIKKYEQYLAHWVSESDRGQSHALNKGFCKATGDLVGWQNSDDYYYPEALLHTAKLFTRSERLDIIYGNTFNVDEFGNIIRAYPVTSFNMLNMIPYLNMCNQSMFFKKRVFEDGCFINETFKHAMDQEFLIRLALRGYRFHFEPQITGFYRIHQNSKGSNQYDIFSRECLDIYKSLYQNRELDFSIRKKSLECIQEMCLDNYGKFRLKLFRSNSKEVLLATKPDLRNAEILFKYILSLLGSERLKKLKNRFKIVT